LAPPAHHLQHGTDDFTGGRVLEQVSRRSRADGLEDRVVLLEDREHDHVEIGPVSLHAARRLDARESRHFNVHEHDLRALIVRHRLHPPEKNLSVSGDENELHVLKKLEPLRQPVPKCGIVFDEGNTSRHGGIGEQRTRNGETPAAKGTERERLTKRNPRLRGSCCCSLEEALEIPDSGDCRSRRPAVYCPARSRIPFSLFPYSS
jgi:hypothetical protein